MLATNAEIPRQVNDQMHLINFIYQSAGGKP